MELLSLKEKSKKKYKSSNYFKHLKIEENNKVKNNNLENNYDKAINHYTKSINNNKENITYLIKRAVCYLAKGYYLLALKDALKAIKIDNKFSKGYYIASLCYLEMYDIENAEKFSHNKNDVNKQCFGEFNSLYINSPIFFP